jgi:spore coat polysaccharide biosynthesis protein SpsF
LALGTVQLGLPYGIANTAGMPNERQAIKIIRTALDEGIRTIDTARAYGDAERRIGLALNEAAAYSVVVVTKLDPLSGIPGGDRTTVENAISLSIERSRAALGRDRLDILLLHRAEHRTKWDGTIWQRLLSERAAGRIGRIGVSIGNPIEAFAALEDRNVEHLQLPCNLLDQRWKRTGAIDALRARPDVTVHARSVFLQGLLAGDVSRWPVLAPDETILLRERLHALARSLGRQSVADLALAYVRGQRWLDAIVIGVETQAQLMADLNLFRTPILSESECHLVDNDLPTINADILDPSRWQKTSQSSDEIAQA